MSAPNPRTDPMVGVVAHVHPLWLAHTLKYLVGALGALTLVAAANSAMLGLSRLAYSLSTNRQIPSGLGRLHPQRSTPYVLIIIAGLAFLGFGQAPPAPNWGLMINENRIGLQLNPWAVVVPAALIAVLTVGTNTFSDAVARVAIGVERRTEAIRPLEANVPEVLP